MGLLDVLNGMQNGPRGQATPGSGGMSPITMALLGLLAYKAYKGATAPAPAAPPSRDASPAQMPGQGGGLGGLLGGLFGGNAASANAGGLSSWLGPMLAGGAGGAVLSRGLGNLISGMSNSGQAQAAQSWVGTGPNQDISKGDLARSIGADDLDALSQRSGLSHDELLEGFRTQLPQLVDQLTPEGRLPTEEEASRWI
jgi:uncharacterized protein YidB (DUF937 family)